MHPRYLLPVLVAVAAAIPVSSPQPVNNSLLHLAVYLFVSIANQRTKDATLYSFLIASGCAWGVIWTSAAPAFWPVAAIFAKCFLSIWVGLSVGEASYWWFFHDEDRNRDRLLPGEGFPVGREMSNADLDAAGKGLVHGSEEFKRQLDEAIVMINQETRPGGVLDPEKGIPNFFSEIISQVLKVMPGDTLDLGSDEFGVREALPPQFIAWTKKVLNVTS